MKSFLHATRQNFSRELAHHVAARLGEGEALVSKALRGMVPVVLCQLIIQTGESGGQALFAQLTAPGWPVPEGRQSVTQLLGILGSGSGAGSALAKGEHLLEQLFGGNRLPLNDFMSDYSGVRPQSSSVLLQLVAVVLASELAFYARQQQLSAPQLRAELVEGKNRAYAWLPADLPNWPGFRKSSAVRAPHAVWATELARPYWVLMLIAAGLALVVFALFGGTTFRMSCQRPATALLANTGPDSTRIAMRFAMDSTVFSARQGQPSGPATW